MFRPIASRRSLGFLLAGCVALLASACSTLSSSESELMNPNDSRTALLVLDLQYDFCHPEGRLHGLVKDELARKQLVDANARLVRAAREHGVTTIITPLGFDYTEAPRELPEGIAGAIVKNRAFDRNGEGGALVAEIAELAKDERVLTLPKPSLSAFAGTELHAELRRRGIEEVVISGLLTNFCVESTARDAFDLGYRVRVVGDATATFDAAQQEHCEKFILPMLGKVISVDEFVAGLN